MSDQGILGTRTWKTWTRGIVSSDDSLLTKFKPSEFAVAKAVAVYPDTAIALRIYGRDTNNDTATIVISGWMDPDTRSGVGAGQVLWKGMVTLGSITFTEKPLNDSRWNKDSAWFEVDTWDSSTGSNASSSIVQSGGNQSILIMPTLGYTRLMLEVADLGGAGEMTELGVLFRPVSKDGVI